ncbi:DUF4845 domain-containing protein [Bacterioplanoides sp. SCSIO 12839]|uniref:DUF4845 domain-containing protein n=1 Tax=Bacterioplanoides sp. SCSIO 12839 TaxID=2829569 RepID=UPI002102A361|nr:DUF4845 domain-containing protein [Bacterioplanoides sp. SCSIO 12839]UTW47248.1 DUF4845 domain-containing protein [Bacterioplanoides sp. SCSIO 12839]
MTKQLTMIKKQSGMSMLPLLMMILVAVMLIRVATSVVPMYFDDKIVAQVLTNVEESGVITKKMPVRKIREELNERLTRNRVSISLDDLVVKRGRDSSTLTLTYEQRGGFFANIELVGRFQHQKELTK